jgi:hypothetical protein
MIPPKLSIRCCYLDVKFWALCGQILCFDTIFEILARDTEATTLVKIETCRPGQINFIVHRFMQCSRAKKCGGAVDLY